MQMSGMQGDVSGQVNEMFQWKTMENPLCHNLNGQALSRFRISRVLRCFEMFRAMGCGRLM
jgi:hypothetical protein